MAFERLKKVIKAAGFPIFIAAIVASIFIFRHELWDFFSDKAGIRLWVEERGFWAPLAFIAIQALQVVVFVIPGEVVQVAGGYIFGFWMGSFWTIIGISLGSVINFYAGRLLGRAFVETLFSAKKVSEFDKVTSSPKAAAGFFLFFLIPGIPKDILCYVAGLTSLKLGVFLAISMTGRLPGMLGSSLIGSAAFAGSWPILIGVGITAIVLFVLGVIFRTSIHDFIAGFAAKRRMHNPESAESTDLPVLPKADKTIKSEPDVSRKDESKKA